MYHFVLCVYLTTVLKKLKYRGRERALYGLEIRSIVNTPTKGDSDPALHKIHSRTL